MTSVLKKSEIDRLHHVGHGVRNIEEGLALYKRLGFAPTPPHFYTIETEGYPSEAIGPINAYSSMRRNFIEIFSVIDPRYPPKDGDPKSIAAPPATRKAMIAQFVSATKMMSGWLADFEGLHILCLRTQDVDETAKRYATVGVANGGANTVNRKVDTKDGPRVIPTRLIEVGAPEEDARASIPEGRVAIAEDPHFEGLHQSAEHPNGAVSLEESFLAADAKSLSDTVARYERYCGVTPEKTDIGFHFDLGSARISVLNEAGLGRVFPGEKMPPAPKFVGYAVAVKDISATEAYLKKAGLSVQIARKGEIFLSSASALGACIQFRAAAS